MAPITATSGTRHGRPPSRSEQVAIADAAKAEQEKKYRALYGPHFDLVQWLRPKVGLIVRHGDGVKVDSRVMTFDQLVDYARAKGFTGPVAAAAPVRRVKATADGRAVGQAVRIEPKKSAPAEARQPRRLVGRAAELVAAAEVHSTDLGTRPRVVWLDLKLLSVDRRYQREINIDGNAHINRILRGFNWNRYQPIIVTERDDGSYAVIDGQHRLEAARKHPLIDALPCYIIDAPDLAAQAAIFVAVNTDRKALTNLQVFWGRVTAGDPEATAIAEACAKAGVTIPRNPPNGGLKALTLLGPTVAVRLAGRLGRAAVLDAIALIAGAWPTARAGFRTPFLQAVATLASAPGYSRERLARTLKAHDPDTLFATAVQAGGNSSQSGVAQHTIRILEAAMGRGT